MKPEKARYEINCHATHGLTFKTLDSLTFKTHGYPEAKFDYANPDNIMSLNERLRKIQMTEPNACKCILHPENWTHDSKVMDFDSEDNPMTEQIDAKPHVSLFTLMKSDEDVAAMCNIEGFRALDSFTEAMDEVYPPKMDSILSTREGILLTTAKLKHDMSFSVLASFFDPVSEVTVRRIFFDTALKLSCILRRFVTRASKEEIKRSMPKRFHKFAATTSVLDCKEIKIEYPNCLKCIINLHSLNKGGSTMKFLIEVVPAGLITFVSKAYGGRAPEKDILVQSAVLEHLEKGRDAVMVDYGFSIDEECSQNGTQLFRPYLRKLDQLSEREIGHNRELAYPRVVIEKVKRRLDRFQILNSKHPWAFTEYIEDIFMICCGLINLGRPVLADDEF